MASRPRTVAYGLVGLALLAAMFSPTAAERMGHPGPARAAVATGHSTATLGHSAVALGALAPIRRIGTPSPLARGPNGSFGTSVTAANWAGYDVTGAGFTSVVASWTQPAAPATSPAGGDAAFWVGLDGDGSPTVEQIGTEAFLQDGTVFYDAWYELYPAGPVTIHMTINPGDEITGRVTSDRVGDFTLTLTDDTTRVSFKKTFHNGPTNPKSAEIIAEAPTDAASGDLLPLVDFGRADFSACAFDGRPLSDVAWNRIDMVSDDDTTLATTTSLGSDGASFSISQPGIADTTPPTTTVAGAGGWHDHDVTLTFSALDHSGSGVALTQYRLDSGPWTDGTTLTLAASADHTDDGPHTVRYRSVDDNGDLETTRSCAVGIDTRRPRVVANWPAAVSRGQTASLRYVIADPRPGSPTATVTVRIVSAKGRLVKTLRTAHAPVDRRLAARFVCHLAKGTYRFRVSASDAAGNAQSKVASERLTVR